MKNNLASLKAGLVAGLTGLLMLSPVLAQAQLAVTIGEGSVTRSTTSPFTFSPNTAVATGGSGSYTFVWSNTHDAFGSWSGGSGQTFSPQVSIGIDCNVSRAVYSTTVTDTVTGEMATSNTADYTYAFIEKGVVCP